MHTFAEYAHIEFFVLLPEWVRQKLTTTTQNFEIDKIMLSMGF